MITPEAQQRLDQILGPTFLTYVLDRDYSAGDALSPAEAAALLPIAPIVERIGYDYGERFRTLQILFPHLWTPTSCWPNDVRVGLGGALLDTSVQDDPVLGGILEIAAEAYPLTLVAHSAQMSRGAMGGVGVATAAIWARSANQSLNTLISSDQDLQTLIGPGMWGVTTGGGGTDATSLVTSIIGYAFAQVRMAGEELNLGFLRAQVAASLDLARRLARGEECILQAVATLEGVVLGQDRVIRMASGRLQGTPAGATYLHVASEWDGTPLLVVDVEARLVRLSADGDGVWDASAESDWRAQSSRIERELLNQRLALVISSEPGILPATVNHWTVPHPVLGGSFSYAVVGRRSRFAGVELDAVDPATVLRWSERTASLPEYLAIGARRLVESASERDNPLDGFVDAVVVWENLFGAESDTMFRVAGAMAHLLEPSDAQARQELFKRLKKLYGERSRLVHGAKEPTYETASQLHDEALRISIRAVRALHDRPDLIDIDTSAARGLGIFAL